MTRLAALSLMVPALLAAQEPRDSLAPLPARRGLVVGVTGFTGGTWQPSGLELGVLRPLGTARYVSAMVRLGSFVQDQAVIYGSTTGFFTAFLVGGRAPLAMIAEVGLGPDPSAVRIVGAIEAGGEVNFRSPLPQGRAMGIAAALVGLSFGSASDRVEQGFAVLAGPAVFFGQATTTHVQVSLRYQNAW